MKISSIKIRGEERPATLLPTATDETLELKRFFAVGTAIRGEVEEHTVKIDDDDVVEIVYDEDISWLCNSDTLSELFPEVELQKRSIGDTFVLPDSLSAPQVDRGIGNLFIKFFRLFKKKPGLLDKKVRELASDFERKHLDNKIGLFRLDGKFQLNPFVPDPGSYLLFLHGTNSSTEKSFADIVGTPVWDFMQQGFGKNILAFQHESLTKSPLENTFDLLSALPDRCDLHLVSQSRGGLIGDLLCRFCVSNQQQPGFTSAEMQAFKKAKRTADIEKINAIVELMKLKQVSIKKYVRVACPGAGTTLASKRLDDFFNITFNLIGIATGITTNPIFAAAKNLLVSVINTKNDPDVLPGLEAMSKESPFIKILNLPGTEIVIDTPLVVIAGNCKARLNLKGLLIIASKLFFMQKNDLIVDTRSMTLGAKRSLPVQRFFDEGGEVDHFRYFVNKSTNEALLKALQSADDTQLIPGFSFESGTRMLESEDRNILIKLGALEGGELFSEKVSGTRPILLLLPGIMGSNLSDNGDKIWIDYLKFISGGLKRLDRDTISASSIVKSSYGKFYQHFSEHYDVVTFAYDWRKLLSETATVLHKKIKQLLSYRQPIKIVGHSMGGVLVRDFIINHPDTWKQLNNSPEFRLIFLGSPLGGSYRIPAVLFGQDSIINKLSKIDVFNSKKDLLRVFSSMEGLLSLLPLDTDADNDFASQATWLRMQKAMDKDWPLPDKPLLDKRFRTYRDKVLAGQDQIDFTNIVYIAGRDKATPCGYRLETRSGNTNELIFLSTAEGDQSVTWDSGIPRKLIEKDQVYYVNTTHGSLANDTSLFKGIGELLQGGSTRIFSRIRPSVRGEEKLFRSPQPDDFDLTRSGVERTILSLGDEEEGKQERGAIKISIAKGDLLYASYPVLVGHFNGDGIVSAEKAINWHLGGELSKRHSLGLYPGKIGTHEILMPDNDRFKGAVIVGLGDLGTLTSYQLAQTVEQGVAKYLLMINSKKQTAKKTGISALIIGSGYGGLTVEGSIRSVIEGVINANNKINALDEKKEFLTIEHIEFIELFEEVALNAFLTLNKLESRNDSSLPIELEPKKIQARLGWRRRLPGTVSEEWWTRIGVHVIDELSDRNYRGIRFTISTGGAREEQRTVQTTQTIIEQLIEVMSTNNQWSPTLAKTLFELLIPTDFKEQLKRQNNINWLVDANTATFPWELLQDGSIPTAKPLCVNAGMVRQFATENYRVKINAVTNTNALVIGDPNLQGFASQLPGAAAEGKLVDSILKHNGFNNTTLINRNSFEIIQSLFSNEYKIIHLAGHGLFNADSSKGSGMLIGKNVFLSTREISQMSNTPEFVFVNCCFLGKTDGVAEEFFQNRFRLAANIGTQLINNGVKAVIAAGWAVDDRAALDFTEVFYKAMFEGQNFGEAIREARRVVYEKYPYTNTWGAYQCYGDQYYRFYLSKDGQSGKSEFMVSAEAENELHNLRNMADTGQYEAEEIIKKLQAISRRVDAAGLRIPAITEIEAFIYADLYDYDNCILKLEALFQNEKADYSVSALEKYCNIRAKKFVLDVMERKGKAADYAKKIKKVIADLQVLLNTNPTAERYNLLGSALKRQGYLIQNSNASKLQAYAAAALKYRESYRVKNNPDLVYPLTNWLTIESILRMLGKSISGTKAGRSEMTKNDELYKKGLAYLKKEENNLEAHADVNNYWDLSKTANAKLCLLIAGTSSTRQAMKEDLFATYKKLWAKAGSKGKKNAEIEHLQILTDLLSIGRTKDAVALKRLINELKTDLKKIS